MKRIILLMSLFLSVNSFSETIINVRGKAGENIWKAVDLISKTEDVSLIQKREKEEFFDIDSITCGYMHQYVCNFFTNIDGQRKFVVALDGALKLIDQFIYNGLDFNEESGTLDVSRLSCVKKDGDFDCLIYPLEEN